MLNLTYYYVLYKVPSHLLALTELQIENNVLSGVVKIESHVQLR